MFFFIYSVLLGSRPESRKSALLLMSYGISPALESPSYAEPCVRVQVCACTHMYMQPRSERTVTLSGPNVYLLPVSSTSKSNKVVDRFQSDRYISA